MRTMFHPRPAARFTRRLLLLALLAAAAGCSASTQGPQSRELSFNGQTYRVVTLNLKRDPLSLHWRDPASGVPYGDIETLQQWGEARGLRLLFAANAGIYDRQDKPLGLHVEDGKTLVPLNMAHGNPASGNFSLLPNGVFAIYPDGHCPRSRTSTEFKADAKPVRWATQSGPMLVIERPDQSHFSDDSGSLKWRSGVCAKSPTEVLFAVSETPVNFHEFRLAVPRQAGLPQRAVPRRQHLADLRRRRRLCRRARLPGETLRGHLRGVRAGGAGPGRRSGQAIVERVRMPALRIDMDRQRRPAPASSSVPESGTTLTTSVDAPRSIVPACCSTKLPRRPCSVPATRSIAT
jgi:Predicted periplasmic protein